LCVTVTAVLVGALDRTVVDDFLGTVVEDLLGTVVEDLLGRVVEDFLGTVVEGLLGTVVLGWVVVGALCLACLGRGAPRAEGGVTGSDSRFSASFWEM
jgi:hypothetical protein